jgi:tetratricopeptide (TPR) repeat protein
LFHSLPPTVQSANTYYYLSLSNSGKKKYKAAEISLNKSIAIYKELNIPHDDLINLKRVIYKANGNYNSASYCFNTVISKPDSPTILDSKAEALYQIGLIEEIKKRNNLALNYYNNGFECQNNNLAQNQIFYCAEFCLR